MLKQEEIQKLASSAKLEIAEEELVDYTKDIDRMIKLADELQEVDTEGVFPTFYGNQKLNVFREDKAIESELPGAMLANAPDTEEGFIRVPVIIESEEA